MEHNTLNSTVDRLWESEILASLSELVTIPRSGHLANLEQPEAFNEALARFLTHRV